MFFKTLRVILGPFLLLGDWLTRPKGIVRPEAEQQAIDGRTRNLALYHFPTCPFCLKTRRTIRRLSLKIELRDAKHSTAHRDALIAEWRRLQLEQAWLADAGQVEAKAREELGTQAPADTRSLVVRP